jgi:S-DNA-T family DNA segregation ATPase FtsK/SpoIIIE
MMLDQATVLIRSLNAISWPVEEDVTQPPDTITFLELFKVKRTEELPLENWWNGEPPYGLLRAPIGKISETHPHVFDLNDRDGAHGPHGLIGGMTGSGKSEVLKAIILALAVTHHPYDLNFALIDFKGGAAFNELKGLPHVVGVVTDIESNATYAERVIQALGGEIERRKRILEEARNVFRFGKSHIDEYQKLKVKKPMPHLVIVFDEFAEFKARYKEESKKLISIARLGRSLGVHLILATQNSEAAIDPEILQNSTFRICLKVSKADDSIQMVGIPDAVNLTRGRAYFRATTRVLYQSAYSGADYLEGESLLPRAAFTKISPNGKRETVEVSKGNDQRKQFSGAAPATEASAVVAQIIKTAQKLHLKNPPSIWPEPLAERVYLPELFSRNFSGGWDGEGWHPCSLLNQEILPSKFVYPILGSYDFPSRQKIFLMQLGHEQGGGNLLIFGSPGSGKSTLLRTLTASLARAQNPSRVNIYILDFGGQSTLKVLEKFPHVGAVVTRIETERGERLIKYIQTEVQRRNILLRNAQADNWMDYNKQVNPGMQIPALYLLIDGFGVLRQTFPVEVIQGLMKLVSGGQATGLFIVAASSLQSDIPEELFANINTRISFSQAKKEEYYSIVGQPSDAKLQEDNEKGLRPGRGLLRGTPPFEFQAALPVNGATDKEQIENLTMLAEKMAHAWTAPRPPEIRSLPELLTLPKIELIKGLPGHELFVEIGQDYEMLAPVGFNLNKDGSTFLVAGNSRQTGKTTFLQTFLISLAQKYSPEQAQVILVDYHTRSLASLANLPNIKAYVDSNKVLNTVLTDLEKEIQHRRATADAGDKGNPEGTNDKSVVREYPHILLVIDDYGNFDLDTRKEEQASAESKRLLACVQQGGNYATSYMIAGTLSELPPEYMDPFLKSFKRQGCGVLLGGTDGIDIFNNMRQPAGQPPAGLPPGRGFLVRKGVARLFQTAVCWPQNENPNEAISKRIEALGGIYPPASIKKHSKISDK